MVNCMDADGTGRGFDIELMNLGKIKKYYINLFYIISKKEC